MFVSLAGPTSPAYSCCPGVLTQSSASGLNQTPSGVGSLTVSFPPRPTSPAYSSRVSVLTQFCALRRVSDSSFTPQANESRVFVRLGVLTQSAPRVLNRAPRIGSLTVRSLRRPTSPACGAQCNRSSPRFERGAPNFARALTFLPRNTCRFADFASGGLQRPQTTFQRDYWGARTSLICSIPRSTLLRLVTCPLFLRLVFSSLPRRVRPIPRVHQRWLAASADNFPFMLADVSRATRAREQLYTAIVSSRRRLSCSRPPERSLERTHIAHLFCPTQYSPTVGLRVLFLQKSSISSCLSLRSHRPIVPLVLVRLQRITKPSKIVTRLVFELFCSLFFST